MQCNGEVLCSGRDCPEGEELRELACWAALNLTHVRIHFLDKALSESEAARHLERTHVESKKEKKRLTLEPRTGA